MKNIIILMLSLICAPVYAVDTTDAVNLNALSNQYFDSFYMPNHPTDATSLGLHQYDDKMEGYSKADIKSQIKELRAYETKFSLIDRQNLDVEEQGDLDLVVNNIKSQLLKLQTIKPFEKNPDVYSSGVTNSAFVIAERKFAPSNDRLKSLIAREKLMPGILNEAKNNLINPPRIYTEIALEQLPGDISFFETDLPAAFKDVDDVVLQKQFKESNAAVVTALKEYQVWLNNDLLPRSHGDFKLGEDTFRKKLKYDEMIDMPLDQLLKIGMHDLRHNQKELDKVIKEIDPNKSSVQVFEDLSNDYPNPDQLLVTFGSNFNDLIGFIKQRHILTIPSDIKPKMEETPPFLRAITLASMDTPGPFEKNSSEAYFNVTLPAKNWSIAKTNNYMRTFNYAQITGTVIHETYPGHYVQFLWMPTIHDRVRKILASTSNFEGWAHYVEQMMLDEGYGSTDPVKQKQLRAGQLIAALLRDSRFIVAIQMHTGKMTFDQAVDFFVKEGRQPRTVALIEVKRGTSDPMYLAYTLGKLQIQKLRADVQKKEGDKFNLQQFHDAFMQQGSPPIKIVRKAMLLNDSETL